MSFFIRKQRRNNETRLSSRTVPKKRKIEKAEEPEEITSEEDEEEEEILSNDDESEDETEQEARLRIAKREIANLREKLEQTNEIVDDEVLGDALKHSVLANQGKVIRKHVAQQFSNNIQQPIVACSSAKALKSPLTCMVVDENGMVYTSSKNGCVIKWEATRRICKFLKPSPVYCLSLGKTVLGATTSSNIQLLSLKNLDVLHKLNTRDGCNVSIMNDTLFSTHKDRTVKVWNISEHAYVESLFGHQDTPTDVDCVEGEDLRAVSCGGFDKTIRVWKINEESQLVFNWDQQIIDVVKVINSVLFVAGTCSGAIGLFSFNRKKPLFVVNQAHGVDSNGVPRWITALGVLRNSDLMASGSDSGDVHIWRIGVKNLDLINTVQVGDSVVITLQFIENPVVTLFAALGVEHANGRWGGKIAKKNSVVKII
ncbi:unnamed protein product [Orchesella dallaii]|uniref:U3 small nucleolar RNA-interacting protein 2 n=1 Tax=Orchesella dallaii TaxID=48710 RepID=A0ABP1QXE0_9HEXA